MSTLPPRHRTARLVPLVLPLVLVAVLLAGCGGGSSAETSRVETGRWGGVINPGGKPERGGTLRIDQAGAATVSSLDYVRDPSNQTGQVVMQIFDRLVEYLPGSLEPQPGLAKSWQVSPNGRTYTFELRDAKFSNGMPVTAADVKYSLDFARRPDSFYLNLYGMISSVRTPDDSTVVVQLSRPTPAFLDYMAYVAASIVPAKVVKAKGLDEFNARPIGSGPFVLERWIRDQQVDLVRNENYWREGRPYLDRVRLSATTDDNTRVVNVQSGTTDVADYVPFSQVATIDQGDSAHVLIAPGGDMNLIRLNNAKKPLDEVEVRRALNYATPVESIVEVVFKGHAPRMNTVLPKMKYWTDSAKAYPYDPEKAKQLLAESSVPNGFSTSIKVIGADQASKQIAQIVQQAWKKVGVDADIEPLEEATFDDRHQNGEYETLVTRPGAMTTDVPVDDEFAQLLFDSPETHNLFSWYENRVTRDLTRKAVTETDEEERARLFERLHVESMQDPSAVPLVYTPNRAAVRDDVHDFHYLLGGLWRLDTVWVEGR